MAVSWLCSKGTPQLMKNSALNRATISLPDIWFFFFLNMSAGNINAKRSTHDVLDVLQDVAQELAKYTWVTWPAIQVTINPRIRTPALCKANNASRHDLCTAFYVFCWVFFVEKQALEGLSGNFPLVVPCVSSPRDTRRLGGADPAERSGPQCAINNPENPDRY